MIGSFMYFKNKKQQICYNLLLEHLTVVDVEKESVTQIGFWIIYRILIIITSRFLHTKFGDKYA